jgi:hypothetical protein
MDIARSFTISASMKEPKFEALEDHRTSALLACGATLLNT